VLTWSWTRYKRRRQRGTGALREEDRDEAVSHDSGPLGRGVVKDCPIRQPGCPEREHPSIANRASRGAFACGQPSMPNGTVFHHSSSQRSRVMRNRFRRDPPRERLYRLFVVACSESTTTSAPSATIKSPSSPSFGYIPVVTQRTSPHAAESPPGIAHTEQLQVCKQYPAGTVNPPAVKIVMDVKTNNPARTRSRTSSHHSSRTAASRSGRTVSCSAGSRHRIRDRAGSCRLHGVEPDHDDQARRAAWSRRDVHHHRVAVYNGNDGQGYIGGYEIPGMLIVFTNTFTPPPPPAPSCTFTQGYWKNHEDVWPAPYSPTAQWMKAGHLVNGTTWDGLMSIAPKGGIRICSWRISGSPRR